MLKKPVNQVCLGWRYQKIQGEEDVKTLSYGQEMEVEHMGISYGGIEFCGSQKKKKKGVCVWFVCLFLM